MIFGIPLLTFLLIVVGTVAAIGVPALVAELSWSGRDAFHRPRRPEPRWVVAW